MSIPVEIGDLEAALADFGSGYLLTVSPQSTVKVVTVDPRVVDGCLLLVDPGKGSRANLAGHATVTLVFPPREAKGFTLLVDGTAEVAGEDVRVTPTGAILHRPPRHGDGPPPPAGTSDACGSECAPVTAPA